MTKERKGKEMRRREEKGHGTEEKKVRGRDEGGKNVEKEKATGEVNEEGEADMTTTPTSRSPRGGKQADEVFFLSRRK